MPQTQKLSSPFQVVSDSLLRVSSEVMAVPFDMARDNYVRAVRAGLVQRSMLQSARFMRALRALEVLTLGMWARKF